MQSQTKKNRLSTKAIAICLLLFFCVGSSYAELAGMGDTPVTEEKSEGGLKALIGVSGGNVLVADDGAICAIWPVSWTSPPTSASVSTLRPSSRRACGSTGS